MQSVMRLARPGLTIFALTLACSGGDRLTDPQGDGEPPEPAWTFCTAEGASCEFQGRRDVRLGPANGPYVQAEAYHAIPCAAYGFGGQNPAPGQPLHCDYGPTKTQVITNPSPGMAGLGANVIVPLGTEGAAGPQVRATTSPPTASAIGAFRTTCGFAMTRFDDPIVYPGQPGASHLHIFFGNTAADAYSTADRLTSTGNSTCRGGTLNRTAYWAPALIDTRVGKVVTPDEATFYYKTGYNVDVRTVVPFPAGLRMIAGDKTATAPQPHVTWLCRDPSGGLIETAAGTVPTTCHVGDKVRLQIVFPQCWDGTRLDSPDHKSHMAYPVYRNQPQFSTCPSTHPVTLPEITEFFDYLVVYAASPGYWRLSSDMYPSSQKGGLSAHADWFNGWNPQTMATIVTQCLNKGLDCDVGTIGDGTTLF